MAIEDALIRLVELVKDDKELHDAIVRYIDARTESTKTGTLIKKEKLKMQLDKKK